MKRFPQLGWQPGLSPARPEGFFQAPSVRAPTEQGLQETSGKVLAWEVCLKGPTTNGRKGAQEAGYLLSGLSPALERTRRGVTWASHFIGSILQ